MDVEQRVGLTPMVMRLAVSYLTRGVGVYEGALSYDTVEVRVLRPWENRGGVGKALDYSQEMQVSFYRGRRRERWVDFTIHISGAGGSPMMTTIEGGKGEEE